MTETPPDTRTPEQIEADMVATRSRLAGKINDLQGYVAPKAVAQRQMDKAKSVYVDEYGGVKPTSVLATVGVVATVIAICVLRRRRRS